MNRLWILRVAVLLLAVFLLAKPEVSRPDPRLVGRWAFLLDTSSSMEVKDPERRMDSATTLFKRLFEARLPANAFAFDETVRPMAEKESSKVKGSGGLSNLAGAVQSLSSVDFLQGAVVVTDGRHVGPGDPISAAAILGKPLFLIGVGNRAFVKDAAVRRIQCPPFAFKNIPTQISAVVSATGYKGRSLSVRLIEAGSVVATQSIPISSDDMETSITFSWTPYSVGSKTVRVEAVAFPDEITSKNNRLEATMNVGRDRFRVLYICGSPGPEYGFLRYQFKSDPAVELVTFVILRNATNVVNVMDDELSLIPFPTQDMLISQMATFDLVVLEEFAFWEFGLSNALLQAVRKRVEGGGGFLLLGGPRVLGVGSFYSSPEIQEMLPVEVGRTVQVSPGPHRFDPRVASHPIVRLEPDAVKANSLWSTLPALEEIVTGPAPRNGATVIGEAEVSGKKVPVLVAWPFKRGRVAVMTSRTTWRWSLIPGAREGAEFAYQRFWKNMVLWLTKAEENKTVRVALEEAAARVGEPATARVWVYDEFFKPLEQAEARILLRSPDGSENELVLNREAAGVFSASWKPSAAGDHRIQAVVKRNAARYGEDALVVRVLEGRREEDDLRPDFATLQEMASVSGGAFVAASDFRADFLSEFEKTALKASSRKVLLWNSPWLFAGIIAALFVEWVLRKRRGLP